MKRSKKKKLNIIRLFIAILILFGIVFLLYKIVNTFKNNKKIYMINVVNKDINNVSDELKLYDIDINKKYEYSDIYDKDIIISQSISEGVEIKENEVLDLVISLGKIDKEKLKSDNINELGKVPIMMYHGIKNMKDSETDYIGGNVDKDGYTRTVESFRRDLEMYYSKGYRMIKLSDYINGKIDVEYGYSPIIITFDDGNDNNIKVTGLDDKGNIIIDKNSAVGVLEEFKKKYPDYNVTAIFFVNNGLFNQPEYNEKILKWLVENGYEVGNHTKNHDNLSKISEEKMQEVVGYMYNKLDNILGDKYSKIIALPFGSPYLKTHNNYKYVLNGTYDGKQYSSEAALRVGWEPEVSPFNKDFDKLFLKRCRAYDNNGKEFDIEMVFRMLENNRYISDGRINTIVTNINNKDIIGESNDMEVILYE